MHQNSIEGIPIFDTMSYFQDGRHDVCPTDNCCLRSTVCRLPASRPSTSVVIS